MIKINLININANSQTYQIVQRHNRDGGRAYRLFESGCSHLGHGGETRNHVRMMMVVIHKAQEVQETQILNMSTDIFSGFLNFGANSS